MKKKQVPRKARISGTDRKIYTLSTLRMFARKMQRCPTYYERLMVQRLSAAGIEHRSQVVVGHFIVDILLDDRMLVLEMDGSVHEGNEAYDQRRDAYLQKHGFTVWRIPNAYVENFNLELIRDFRPLLHGRAWTKRMVKKANKKRNQLICVPEHKRKKIRLDMRPGGRKDFGVEEGEALKPQEPKPRPQARLIKAKKD